MDQVSKLFTFFPHKIRGNITKLCIVEFPGYIPELVSRRICELQLNADTLYKACKSDQIANEGSFLSEFLSFISFEYPLTLLVFCRLFPFHSPLILSNSSLFELHSHSLLLARDVALESRCRGKYHVIFTLKWLI